MRFLTTSCLLVTALAVSAAFAGAPASSNRDATLPHRCAGPPAHAVPCTTPDDCPSGRCIVDATNARFAAVVTFVVDDNVSQFDGSESVDDVVAVTVLVEAWKYGSRLVLSQTYQNLSGDTFDALVESLQAGPFIADTGNSNRRVTESQLTDATTEALLDDFLLQRGDGAIADALRAFYGTTGAPVVLKAERLERWSQGGSELASVVRLKVRGRFVAQ
jgi:hypothetical protein